MISGKRRRHGKDTASSSHPKRIRTKHEGTIFVLDVSNEFRLEKQPSMDENLSKHEPKANASLEGKPRSSSLALETSFANNSFVDIDYGYHTV